MKSKFARVVELADTRDLKSLGSDTIPVQVRSRAPYSIILKMLTVAKIVETNLFAFYKRA